MAMKFHRQHYNILAARIGEAIAAQPTIRECRGLYDLTKRLIATFSADNPTFDPQKFADAIAKHASKQL